jgi:hypothetical protein
MLSRAGRKRVGSRGSLTHRGAEARPKGCYAQGITLKMHGTAVVCVFSLILVPGLP